MKPIFSTHHVTDERAGVGVAQEVGQHSIELTVCSSNPNGNLAFFLVGSLAESK